MTTRNTGNRSARGGGRGLLSGSPGQKSGQVGGYIAILGIVISLVGVLLGLSPSQMLHRVQDAPSAIGSKVEQARCAFHTCPTYSPPPPASGTVPVGHSPKDEQPYAVQAQPAPGSCHYGHDGAYPLPDPKCTPGATNPDVTQATIQQTICVRGWTATIRPPQGVTGPEKRGSAAAYGYTGSSRTSEYDHLLPLELGGDPNARENLWLEPNDNPAATSFGNAKDPVENAARAAVCGGTMQLAVAQQKLATNWVTFGRELGVIH